MSHLIHENAEVTLVEVGPRDGIQAIAPIIPTATKIALVKRLYACGVRRIEAAAFVSEKTIPQMADASDVLAAAQRLHGLDVQVLVPNQRYAEKAVAAGARHIAFVFSLSDKHNSANVRRTSKESALEYCRWVSALPQDIDVRLNLATAFDCPFEGLLTPKATLDLLARIVDAHPNAEVALCDTTGRVTADRVRALFLQAMARFPETRWAFHGHDTYGLGVANVLAAYGAGVRVFDASFAGLGGCPFAPGATGNVATEDVAWTLDQMGIATGINLEALIVVAEQGAALPGALVGGRVRSALRAARTAGLAPGAPAT